MSKIGVDDLGGGGAGAVGGSFSGGLGGIFPRKFNSFLLEIVGGLRPLSQSQLETIVSTFCTYTYIAK